MITCTVCFSKTSVKTTVTISFIAVGYKTKKSYEINFVKLWFNHISFVIDVLYIRPILLAMKMPKNQQFSCTLLGIAEKKYFCNCWKNYKYECPLNVRYSINR